MALQVTINGQLRGFDGLEAGATVLDLIAALELKGDRVALELNGGIAPRTAWGTMPLADGDKVELVHFVGGGCGLSREGLGRRAERSGHPGATSCTWMARSPDGCKDYAD